MKTHWKISIVCFQLLLVLGCSLGTQATVKTDQFDEGTAAYQAGNYQKALELFKPFAEQGDAKAQYNLGIMYGYGRGVPQNNKEAVKWYRKAAEQGYVLAQYNLGIMYGYGRGVPQNNKEAVKWYRKAAEQGLAIAQYNLGIMYGYGRGVPQNNKEAVKWYRKAAEQGLAIAQYNFEPGGVEISFDPGWGFNGAVGYDMGEIRVEGEIGFRLFDVDEITVFPFPPISVSDDVTALTFMVNGYYDMETPNSPWTPYVGFGLGFLDISIDITGGGSFSETEFAYQGMLGLGYESSPNTVLTAGYRFFGFTDNDGAFIHELNLGARFMF